MAFSLNLTIVRFSVNFSQKNDDLIELNENFQFFLKKFSNLNCAHIASNQKRVFYSAGVVVNKNFE